MNKVLLVGGTLVLADYEKISVNIGDFFKIDAEK